MVRPWNFVMQNVPLITDYYRICKADYYKLWNCRSLVGSVLVCGALGQTSKQNAKSYDHYNPSVGIIDLVSSATCFVCVNFYTFVAGRSYSLESTSDDRFFEKPFLVNLFTHRVFCQKYSERKSPKKYYLYFILMSGPALESCFYVL